MNPYKKVLCGLDFNDDNVHHNVGQIMKVAMALTSNEPDHIHLAHVCDSPVTGYGEGISHHHSVTEAKIRQNTYPYLKHMLEIHHLPASQGHIIFGPTTDAMHQLARELNCELIIIGKHNRSILSRLLGSTTNHILQGAPCDVLTVNLGGLSG